MKTMKFKNEAYPDGRFTFASQGEGQGSYDKGNLSSIIRYLYTHMGINKDDIISAHNRLYDRLKEIEDAISAGQLISTLPCQKGDAIWLIGNDTETGETRIITRLVEDISLLDGELVATTWDDVIICYKDFGVAAYMSEEDAKVALSKEVTP